MDDCLCDETQFPSMSDFPDDIDILIFRYFHDIRSNLDTLRISLDYLENRTFYQAETLIDLFHCASKRLIHTTCWYLKALREKNEPAYYTVEAMNDDSLFVLCQIRDVSEGWNGNEEHQHILELLRLLVDRYIEIIQANYDRPITS